ncbi:MAG: hypothetical protein BGO69_12185 [Bacteroidetes bacterium 46-16]|nr:MAG: hypothetical protein BGO69_12185 [Bacteroidetes bacterium 46-16]
MRKALGTILQYVIFLGLGIWIIFHMITTLKPEQRDELVNAIQSVNAWLLIPIFIAGFLSHIFRALRWRLLLEPLKIYPGLVNTTFAVLIGYVMNLVLPRAGEVAKCTILARYEKVPAHKMVGTIVSERAFDLLCLFVIAAAAFTIEAHVISDYVADLTRGIYDKILSHRVVLMSILAGLAVIAIALILVYRRHKETKVGHFMREMSHGIMSILHMKKRGAFLGYTFLIWFMYTAQIYLGFLSLQGTEHLAASVALVVLVYGAVGMIITPGGIGAYTLLVAEILTAYNISEVSAQAFGWIAWAAQTGILIILGVCSLLLINVYNRKRHVEIAVDRK